MTGFAVGGGFAIVALIALVIALYDRGNLKARIGELETAIANARADSEKNRADVAEKQTTAALAAEKEAEGDADRQFETALKSNDVVDPTSEWDARSDASGPVRGVVSGVLPRPAAGAGSGARAEGVPDRGPDAGAAPRPVAAPDPVRGGRS